MFLFDGEARINIICYKIFFSLYFLILDAICIIFIKIENVSIVLLVVVHFEELGCSSYGLEACLIEFYS